ncbi:MAG: ATP-binding protein [Paracoccaceae bacterium]
MLRMLPIRLIIPMTIAALIGLLVLLGVNLQRELRLLSTDNSDKMAWTFLQTESEIANLGRILAEQQLAEEPRENLVRLRADIAISRINLVTEGRFPRLMEGNLESQHVLEQLRGLRTELEAILDSNPTIGKAELAELSKVVHRTQPLTRRISVLGNAQATQVEGAQRRNFSNNLAITGGIALSVLFGMSGLLIILGRLLERARDRDVELSATTERLSSTVAAALDGIVVADADWCIVEYNQAAKEIFGWRRDEVLGAPMEDTFIPVHNSSSTDTAATKKVQRIRHIVDKGRCEILAMRKTGETFPMEISVAESGQLDSPLFISYLRDISQRKITETELIDARDSAEKADKAKSQFLSVMSHEMRTPLNGLLGVLDLLRTTRLTKRQERHIEVAAASGELLLEHVNEALDITRIESGALSITEQRFCVRETLARVVDVLEPLAREKSLFLTFECDEDLTLKFMGDKGRISQIITNLVGNAIKFTEQGGIAVKVSGIHGVSHSLITITVQDTGPGIPNEFQEKIFEHSFVLNPTEGRQSRSDGLGLSISRRIARLMGGELNVHSHDAEGSVFSLTVPLNRSPDQEANADLTTVRLPASALKKEKEILVVEDNAVNRMVLQEMLIAMGHNVFAAKTGSECVEMAFKDKFDLIIMDLSMPDLNGLDATRELRSGDGPNCDTFVLGLTAHGADEYKSYAEDAGMDAFETKPIRLNTLSRLLSDIPAGSTRQSEKAAATNVDCALDTDVATELLGLLGRDRFKQAVAAFFHDADTALDVLDQAGSDYDQEDLRETLHRLRGGANIFGLCGIVLALDNVTVALDQVDQAALALEFDGVAEAVDAGRAVTSTFMERTHPKPSQS